VLSNFDQIDDHVQQVLSVIALFQHKFLSFEDEIDHELEIAKNSIENHFIND